MVDTIEPWDNMDEQLRIPRVSRCHSLQVGGNLRGTKQRLAILNLVNHLPIVQFDFSRVLRESVEAVCTIVSQSAKEQISRVLEWTYCKIVGKEYEDPQQTQERLLSA